MMRVSIVASILLSFLFTTGNCQIIATFAGTGGIGGFSGDNGPATAAKMVSPSGVCADHRGNVYIADQNGNRIRKVDSNGYITTIAGTGSSGYSGDGGIATAAAINWPSGVTVDRWGTVYIADQFNNAVRKIDTFGIITTVAGNGSTGFTGDGGPATSAELWHPVDVGVDYAGNIYVLDQDNSAVRKIAIATSHITTLAGDGSAGYAGDGGPATAAKLNFPQGIAVDSAGDVWVADYYNSRVRMINSETGMITTVSGGGSSTAEGVPATDAAFGYTSALARDRQGNLYINDCYGYKVRKVFTNGIINTIAGDGTSGFSGDGGAATAAEISVTEGLATNDSGDVFIADFNNAAVRIVTRVPATASVLAAGNIAAPGAPEVFPNPCSGSFTIAAAGNSEMQITLYDMMGKEVYHGAANTPRVDVNLAGAPAGVYTLCINYGGYPHNTILIIRY